MNGGAPPQGRGSGAGGEECFMVTCSACGGASHDLEFCDHCNADLLPGSAVLPPAVCPLLPATPLTPRLLQALSRPEASVMLVEGEQCWRVHWIAADQWPLWRPRLEERLRYPAMVLPPCRVVEEAAGVWVA